MKIEDDLYEKLNKLEISKAKCLFVANDMAKIGLIEGYNKNSLLETIFKTIKKINPEITIVVPTATLNLIKNNEIFNLNNTKSFKMGAFSEYVRKLKNTKRSFHALWSLSANGPLSNFITKNVSKHAYDENSSFARIFQINNSYFLSLGNHPRFMLSIIHYFETKYNVPYRFTKSFKIKCEKSSEIKEENFLLEVLNENLRYNKRSFNKKIFENFETIQKLKTQSFGKGNLYCFEINKFYKITSKLFLEDINCWWK